ncbi:MAG: COX15/CtaA family protein [Angustibacter sp.]
MILAEPVRTEAPDHRAPRWFLAVLRVNLSLQILIVVTGGLVRLTGSGLGCPTWPQCVPGSFTPVVQQPQGVHKIIEFGNRLLTSVVGLAALAVLLGAILLARRQAQPRRDLWWASVPLLGVILQAIVGGITVLTALHPATVALHFLISMQLIAGSTILLRRIGQAPAARQPIRREIHWLGWAVAGLTAVVLILGTIVTGSGPHSGDKDEPARFNLNPQSMSWLHADAVLLWCGALVALLLCLRLTNAPDRVRRATAVSLAVGLGQGLIGYVQYLTGLPIIAVAGHMLGACLLTVAVTNLLSVLRRETYPVKNLADFTKV